ncbi:hypothetical protein [Bradyrhizobium sp. USDA 4508]
MQSKEIIRLTAAEFIEAVRAGLVQYIEKHIGASIDGRFFGEYEATISGAPIRVVSA